jgi:RNA polymerase sigma-70 factor (ECF subfamily)
VDNGSDSALISRVLVDDDRHAFSELVRRHQSQVRRLLRKLTGGDATLADDLAQEAFLRGYRSLKSYRGTARFSTWLCQIAYHCYLTEAGRVKTRAEVPEEAARPAQDAAPAASREARTLLQRDLERALASLNGEEREAIALAFGQDLSHEEAAAVLGCPLGTLKSRINRGLEKLELRMISWRSEHA